MDNASPAAQARATPARRLAWIDEARGFLAIYVVLHHAAINIDRSGLADGLSAWVDLLFGWGHPRVDLFFLLSAFCLALPAASGRAMRPYGEFVGRRIWRLLPPYYAALALTLLLDQSWIGGPSGTHWDVSLPVTAEGILSHVLLVHPWWSSTTAQISHPFWSIGVEFQLCLLLPLLVALGHRLGPWWLAVACTWLGYAAWRVSARLGFPDASPWGASLYYLAVFGIGIATAFLYAERHTGGATARWGRTAFGVTVALMGLWALRQWTNSHHLDLQILSFFVAVGGAGLLLHSRRWPARHDSQPRGAVLRGLNFLGQRSYSLYLVHAPVLQLVWLYGVRPLQLRSAGQQAIAMIVIGSLASLLVGLAFHAWIERPSMTWFQHRAPTGRPAVS